MYHVGTMFTISSNKAISQIIYSVLFVSLMNPLFQNIKYIYIISQIISIIQISPNVSSCNITPQHNRKQHRFQDVKLSIALVYISVRNFRLFQERSKCPGYTAMNCESPSVQEFWDHQILGVEVHGKVPRLTLTDPQLPNDVTGENLRGKFVNCY